MSESSDDPLIARVAGELRRPVPISPDFDARVMASVRRAPPARALRAWAWLREPRTLAVSPLGGLAMAAGVAGLMLVGIWGAGRSAGSREQGAGSGAAAVGALAAGAPASVTFVFLAPEARSVALAGDFDGWDPARLPMQRQGSGLWTVDRSCRPAADF